MRASLIIESVKLSENGVLGRLSRSFRNSTFNPDFIQWLIEGTPTNCVQSIVEHTTFLSRWYGAVAVLGDSSCSIRKANRFSLENGSESYTLEMQRL